MKNNGTFFVAASALIINDRNQILLTQRSFDRSHHLGEWETQSGRLLQDESIIEALIREMQEELSITVEPIMPISTFHFYRGYEKIEHIGVTYVCKIKSGKVKVDGKEEIAFQWVDVNEAKSIVKDQTIVKDIDIFQELLQKGLFS